MYHQSDTMYETEIIHENEHFSGFTLAAMTMALDLPDFAGASPLATSEVRYTNLLVEDAPVGVLINGFNCYVSADTCRFVFVQQLSCCDILLTRKYHLAGQHIRRCLVPQRGCGDLLTCWIQLCPEHSVPKLVNL
jgi:hypothetical protein